MNGVHDMGGMHGMGPIEPDSGGLVFSEPWKGRVYAMIRSMGAWRKWTLDADRYSIELLPPDEYLRASYYERRFLGLIGAMLRHEVVREDEIATGQSASGSTPATPALGVERVPLIVNRGIPSSQEAAIKPKFKPRQRVRALNINPPGHTRLPRYARGKVGTIALDHGVYSFPDTNAHGLGEKRQHVYSVRFASRELWGDSASPRDFVHLDMWDDYLERA